MAEQDITSKLEAMNRISELVRQRDDLLAVCEGLTEDLELIEQDEGITACQCMAKCPDDIVEPPPCNYCQAKAAIAKAQPSSTSVQPKKSGVLR